MQVHRFAVAAALATFALLVAGGLVSTTESGLACPDWPLCEGEFFPPMSDGKQFEHTHRLVASLVAVMTFGLCALLFKHRKRDRLLKGLGLAAAALVVAQALLGATTVWLKLPWWVSSAHLSVAMLFFCVSVTIAVLTRQRLSLAPAPPESARLGKAVLPVLALAYAQVVVGAVMRHLRGGLACGMEFPLCLGEVWPLGAHLGVQIHMVHRVLGTLVAVAVLGLAAWMWRRRAAPLPLKLLSAGAAAVALTQALLGVLTVLWSREMATMTLHSSGAAGLLGALTWMYWLARPLPARGAEELQPAAPATLEVA
ncbi:MAG: heme A synthase [Myxococcales bacterium]|nr:heme A synthase [Myxococcales bacterium]